MRLIQKLTLIASLSLASCAHVPSDDEAKSDATNVSKDAAAATVSATADFKRTAAWNSETSDLPVDDSIIYGELSNGLKYAIRPNNRPENEIRIRMAIDFGSAAEEEDEQGLAHFIEHMAFNGTTNVPEGEMVKMLERLGLQFGADTNASTGYLRTIYKLNLPKTDESLIDQSLFLMRETASEITFDAGAVDRERGVVISEKRQRENYNYRSYRARTDFFYPNTYFANRYPIGTQDILENATAQKMKALHRKWYRPDRTRIIVVGPIDPDKIEAMIAEKFASWQNDGPKLRNIDQCDIPENTSLAGAQFNHPEIYETIILQKTTNFPRQYDSFNSNLRFLKLQIANSIIAKRVQKRIREDDIPLLASNLSYDYNVCNKYAVANMRIVSKDGQWSKSMPIAEKFLRQALQYGFQKEEIDEQIKNLDASYDNAVKRANTRRTGGISSALTNMTFNVISTPQQNQDIWNRAKSQITKESIFNEFKAWYSKLDAPLIFYTGKEKIDPTALTASYNNSRKIAVSEPERRKREKFAYTNFGNIGKIASDKRIDDLGIRTVAFENNVMLNIKKTDFEDNRIRFRFRIAGGSLAFGKELSPLAGFMNRTYASGGLGKHDTTALNSILVGTTVSRSFNASAEYFGGSGSVSAKDLERQMQIITAYITDPGYREEAVRLYRKPLDEVYARIDATPGSALNIASNKIMTDEDPRFAITPLAAVKKHDFEQLKDALGDMLMKNQIEIGLVGDIDEDKAIAIIAKTFGALPTRNAKADPMKEARQSTWSSNTGIHQIPHRGEKDQLTWRRVWPTTDNDDQRLTQTMYALARVVSVRLIDELREKLGASYGGSASSYMSSVYDDRGSFSISTAGDPKDIKIIEEAVEKIVQEILAKPVSDDIFKRAVQPRLESYKDWRTQNSTWMGIVDTAQTRPDYLERFRQSEDIFRSLTPKDVHVAAKRFLENKDSFIFRAIPNDMAAQDTEN